MQTIGIFGMPRSGTTWLGKIFDSHPLTLLRHEPDTVTPTTDFPFNVANHQIPLFTEAARKYLEQRRTDKQLRCVSNMPYFDKDYRNASNEAVHRFLLFLGKSANALAANRLERRISIPDLCDRSTDYSAVIKSVESVGRLPLFARACPHFKFIFIIRHPCGVVASKLRGQALGKLDRSTAFRNWLALDSAVRRGLTLEELQTWDELETSTWGWKLYNEHVMDGIAQQSNVKLLKYEDLCEAPITIAKDLLNWSGLGWHSQCETYIDKCINVLPDQKATYYSTVQNPQIAAMKWKKDLTAGQIQQIEHICRDSTPGKLFFH